MANLDPKKMLPSSKSFLAKTKNSFIVPQSKMIGTKKINVSDVVKSSKKQDYSDKIQEDIYEIKVKVIDIEKLLKSSFSEQKKLSDRKRRTVEKGRRESKEKKLEEKPKRDLNIPKIKSFPKVGLLDTIKKFILNTVLGFFAVRILDQLPLLTKFLTVVGYVADFIIDVGGKLLNGLVTFIDWGYKAYDATRGFLKNIGGDDLAKKFDGFSEYLNKFINLAIVAGLLAVSSGGLGGGKGGRGGPKSKLGQGGRPRVTTSGGKGLGRPAVRNPFRQRPRVTTSGGGAGGFRNPFGAKPKITGSGANKGIARLLGKGLGRVPIVGGLIDFAINLLLGENPGRAAARAVGSSIGASLGGVAAGAVGSVVPIAGTMVGGLIGATLGGLLGDAIGGSLYDVLVGTKQKMAEGGKVTTRSGKIVGGGATRSLKKTKRKLEARMPDDVQLNPGEGIGGDTNLKKLFPESSDPKTMSPFGVVEGTAKQFSGVNYLGPLFGVFSKVLLGQKPSAKDYENIGLGINAWITKGINSGDIKGGISAAFAEGGVVDSSSLTGDSDISKWVEYSSKDLLNSAVDESTKNIMKNLMLQPATETKTTAPGEEPGSGMDGGAMGAANDSVGGARLFMQLGFPMLAASILSGNIQQESGWKGQRTPWVLNDGAGTNKGLISWNRGRIKNAEKFLGKPLEKASNAEQTKWIKEELKQYGLLDDFMNPKATEDQLKAASYKYIGWGDVGARWKYSSQILAALQRGEKGTFTSGGSSGISLGKGYGSAGSKISGELGRFIQKRLRQGPDFQAVAEHPEFGGVKGTHARNSYHYSGRAIDIGAYAHEQGPILKVIADFNKMKGVKPVELLKAGDPGHSDHVHVAYREGGFANGPQYAMLGEEGTEAITDADSTKLLGKSFFATINAIENKSQLKKHAGSLINTLNSYAGYENGAPIMVVDPGPSPVSQQENASPKPKSDPFRGESSNSNTYDPFNKLYALG